MPDGLVRTDLNKTGTSFRQGTPITLPHSDGITINTPVDFGNDTPVSDPTLNSNPVTWVPSSAHFGNVITPAGAQFIGSICAINTASSTNDSTTGASGGATSLNTTGATILVAFVRATSTPTIVDSATVNGAAGYNTWTYLKVSSGTSSKCLIAYCINPSTSTTHWFEATGTFGSCEVFAFKGVTGWSVDSSSQSTNTQSGTTVVSGSINLAGTGEVVIVGIGSNSTQASATVNNGFNGGQGVASGAALCQLLGTLPELGGSAYLIDASSSSISATFTTSHTNSDWVWAIAAFKHS